MSKQAHKDKVKSEIDKVLLKADIDTSIISSMEVNILVELIEQEEERQVIQYHKG